MKILVSILAICFLMGLSGCTEVQEKCDVVAVYLHEPGHYSVMVKEGNELLTRDFKSSENTRIFTDVPSDKPCYYEVTKVSDYFYLDGVKIHIHSIDDIGTAGWKKTEGKTTKQGETQKLEI